MTSGRRRIRFGLAGIALVGALTTTALVTIGDDTDQGDTGRSNPAAQARGSETTGAIRTGNASPGTEEAGEDGALRPGDTPEKVGQPTKTEADVGNSTTNVGGGEFGLAVGVLQEGLILEAPLSYYREQSSREQRRFEARRASPFVGGAWTTAMHGRDLLLVATNHAELVRLRDDWETVDTMLPFEGPNKALPDVGYGSLLVDGDTLWVSYSIGRHVGISEIDLAEWRVTRQQVYADRFAAFPQACFLNPDQLALVTTGVVSVIDRATLTEQHVTELEGNGLACVDGSAWVSDFDEPRGWTVTADGSVSGTFSWQGDGSTTLAYSRDHGRVFGTDPTANRVFSCDVNTRDCSVGNEVGDKPTSLLIDGDTVYVTEELSEAVALVRADDLSLIGRVRVPGFPRTLTIVPKP